MSSSPTTGPAIARRSGRRRQPVRLRWPPTLATAPRLVLDDVVDGGAAQRHDPDRLAAAVMRILEREGTARRRLGATRTA